MLAAQAPLVCQHLPETIQTRHVQVQAVRLVLMGQILVLLVLALIALLAARALGATRFQVGQAQTLPVTARAVVLAEQQAGALLVAAPLLAKLRILVPQ